MMSGLLIREARLLAGLSQGELGERVVKDRAQIARWERGAVEPSFETLRELVEACGFELSVAISPRSRDEAEDAELREKLRESPQERVQGLLRAREK
ncbi:MAG: helix-turn-helix transcriptional regulator [Actinobacteria bacterium]|nr:helix-turn-helix transcriptional regulator [Actinomycetota bacterium]